MSVLSQAQALQDRGRFKEALAVVESANSTPREDRLSIDVIRAELYERIGRYQNSRTLAQRLLSSPGLTSEHRARCEYTLGLIESDEGRSDAALAHFQRSITAAKLAKTLAISCLAQLRLIVLLSDRSGLEATAPLLSQVRSAVTKLGNPTISATLHILVGAMETRRGLVENGVNHTLMGLRVLGGEEHLWLQAVAQNTLVAAAIMRADIVAGIDVGRQALETSEQSGAAAMRRAALANLGNLFYQMGQFDVAIDHFLQARAILTTSGERDNATVDSIALSLLAEGRTHEAFERLAAIDEAVSNESDWLLYGNRHSRLTRTYALLRLNRLDEALHQADEVLRLAATVGDRFLLHSASIARADALQRLGRRHEFLTAIERIAGTLADVGAHLQARYMQLLVQGYAAAGQFAPAEYLYRRARQIHIVSKHLPGQIEIDTTWHSLDARRSGYGQSPDSISTNQNGAVLQNVAALMLHAGRPELVATGLVAILEDTDGVVSASAVSLGPEGAVETLSTFTRAATGGEHVDRVLAIGAARGRQVEVRVRLRHEIGAVAAFNAVALLLGTVHDLERARAEREERLTLWPLDDSPPDGEQAVVMGALREVMINARRVASTSIGVLITGESGTGKEIVARAIHRYSARADRAFVPFNCAAIPREMLESQLFGHRRGAFTGADRDHPGVIRAAKDGTLLLDEVGELSLELQPKLLRFLESGEIAPLGEAGPTTVDVRVIAATNANLEQLVAEGRFREDLFYRLNVIKLVIPPLRERRDEIPALVHHFVARAAQEFGKSRIRVAEETMEHLLLYPWPGNVRQLNNELRRMVALAESDTTLRPSALSREILRAFPRPSRGHTGEISVPLSDKLGPTLWRIEREMIKAALKTSDGKVDAAARALGISRKGLYLKRQRLGL
jgi:DNA-binding NtrC family response regulator/tetratricopeptide (TPR) repeat protein